MGKLWEPKKDYKQFDPEAVAEISRNEFTYSWRNYLPYERLYDNLNERQLQELLEDARRLKWPALDLSRCELLYLPDELWELTELRILHLGNQVRLDDGIYEPGNEFRVLPRKIEKLNKLQYLDLYGLRVEIEGEFPLRLENLVLLNLRKCPYTRIPKALQIPSLRRIEADSLDLTYIDDFCAFENLRYMDSHIFKFERNEELKFLLLFNSIRNWPFFDRLEYLDVSQWPVEPFFDFFECMPRLGHLGLSYTPITNLPESVYRLINLRVLDLAHTQISALPDSIGKLTNLQRLFVDDTQISVLPDSIHCQQLRLQIY